MKVLVTGAGGFIGKNLRQHLAERRDIQVVPFTRDNRTTELPVLLTGVEAVIHLAGINRPQDPREFVSGNTELTKTLCDAIGQVAGTGGRPVLVVFASSVQAERDNPYGSTKHAAERALLAAAVDSGIVARIFRLPNIFGKWCKPDYNSAVATFCYRIARGLPIQVNDPDAPVTLAHVDDLIEHLIRMLDGEVGGKTYCAVSPQYTTTVGELAARIESFRESRSTLVTDRVGDGLARALYSTYVSYLPTDSFKYEVPRHADARGVFIEMLKTPDCGQLSYFTAHPGITRGGHYHHCKTEKFLVLEGKARFRFRHMVTNERVELFTSGVKPEIVETIPGWAHDITNVGDNELVVMLWANEVFDRSRPDTYAHKV